MTAQEFEQYLLDNLVTEKALDSEYRMVDDIMEKLSELMPQKLSITKFEPNPNTPLWLWHKGSKTPVLANYRKDYPNPLFWEIVDGDYINNSNSIPIEKAEYWMYVNKPEE